MARCFLALGANKGDRLAALERAVAALDAQEDIRVVDTSPVYENAAHTLDEEEVQPDFLNAAVAVETAMEPYVLLRATQAMEQEAGRDAVAERWAPRVLDIDLITYGGLSLRTDALELPHPRLAERRFVLRPLVDLDPDLYIPSPFDATVSVLLARCPDQNPLRRTSHVLLLAE